MRHPVSVVGSARSRGLPWRADANEPIRDCCNTAQLGQTGWLALLGLVDRTVRMPGRGDARVNCKQRNQFTAQPPAALPAFAATPRPSFSYRASRTRVPAAGQREGVAEADLAGSTSLSPG